MGIRPAGHPSRRPVGGAAGRQAKRSRMVRRRRIAPPIIPNPPTIIAHADGSGAAERVALFGAKSLIVGKPPTALLRGQMLKP